MFIFWAAERERKRDRGIKRSIREHSRSHITLSSRMIGRQACKHTHTRTILHTQAIQITEILFHCMYDISILSSPSLLFCNRIQMCWLHFSFWVWTRWVSGQDKGWCLHVRAEIRDQGHHSSALDLQQSRTNRRMWTEEKKALAVINETEIQKKCQVSDPLLK